MKKNINILSVLGLVLMLTPQLSSAQLLSGSAYMKGKYVEVGQSAIGTFGTNRGVPTDGGYHPRGSGTNLGFVADPARDGWTTGTPAYIGDYFLPGSPQEGWDITMVQDGTTYWNQAWNAGGGGFTSYSSSAGGLILSGKTTDYEVDGTEIHVYYEGKMGDLSIFKKTTLDTTKGYFTVEVELKNVGTKTIKRVYYERTVDPDNEAATPGSNSFVTKNTVEFQPKKTSTGTDNRCLVSAIGPNFPSLSYLGLAAMDCRALCYIIKSGLMTNTRPDITYDSFKIEYDQFGKEIRVPEGHSSSYGWEGDTYTQDVGVSLVFNLGDLASGDKVNFAYAYILSEDDIDSAFKKLSTATFGIGGHSYASKDTVWVCPGSEVDISIDGASDWEWSDWFPTTGLKNDKGRKNTALIGFDTVVYKIAGKNICDDRDTISVVIAPYGVKHPGKDGYVELCAGAPEVNLFDYLKDSPEKGGVWSGVGVTADGKFSSIGFGEGLYDFIYTQTAGFCVRTAKVTVNIINRVDLKFDTDFIYGCETDTLIINNRSEELTAFKWKFGDGTENTTDFHPTHVYSARDQYEIWLIGTNTMGCSDSTRTLIDTRRDFDVKFTMERDSVCQNYDNYIGFNDVSKGEIVSRIWDFGDGETSTEEAPVHQFTKAGYYYVTLTATDNSGCVGEYKLPVYVDSTPYIKVKFLKDEVCVGESVDMEVDVLGTKQSVSWNMGDGTIMEGDKVKYSHTYAEPGLYYVNVKGNFSVCSSVSAFDSILVKPTPIVNLGIDTTMCLGAENITLDANRLGLLTPEVKYEWNTGEKTVTKTVKVPGKYYVTVDLNGCTSTDEAIVEKGCYLDIPNAFTPNGDGSNDYFLPRDLLSKGVIDFKMVIYNRWGEKVFETTSAAGSGWDGKFGGKDQPSGVYVYTISVTYENMASETYDGNITLMR